MERRRIAHVSSEDEEPSSLADERRRRKQRRLRHVEEDDETLKNKTRPQRNGRGAGDGVGEEESEEEVDEDEEAKAEPLGEVLKVTGKGKKKKNHYGTFEFKGNLFELEDSVLLTPEDSKQKPYVVIIKDITEDVDENMMITGQWFYRPEKAEKQGGGNWQARYTRELFYSFHRDDVPAESVMHKCVVHFVPLHKKLPIRSQHPGFIVQKVYDTVGRKLWKLTDKDYEDGKQHEIDLLVQKTRERLGNELEEMAVTPELREDAEANRRMTEIEQEMAEAARSQPAEMVPVIPETSEEVPSLPTKKTPRKGKKFAVRLQPSSQRQEEVAVGEEQAPFLVTVEEQTPSPMVVEISTKSSQPSPAKRARQVSPKDQQYEVGSLMNNRLEEMMRQTYELQDEIQARLMEKEDLRARLVELERGVEATQVRQDRQSAWLARLSQALGEISRRVPTRQAQRELIELQVKCMLQSYDMTALPSFGVESSESLSENMRLLKAMVEGLHAQMNQSELNLQKTYDDRARQFDQRLRTLEESTKQMEETLLPRGSEEIDDWAKFKSAQFEGAMVFAAHNGWLRSTVIKDRLFKEYMPSRYEEVVSALLHEPTRDQQRRDARKAAFKGKQWRPPLGLAPSTSAAPQGAPQPAKVVHVVDQTPTLRNPRRVTK